MKCINVSLAAGFMALLAMLGTNAWAGTFANIVIDGAFADWAGVPVLDSDPADNAGSVDIADVQIANDNHNLYIRTTYHGALAQSTFIAMDVDQNTATGFDIFSLGLIGSEAGWQNDFAFEQFTGVYNTGWGLSGPNFGGGHALMSPFGDSSSREWSISLSAMFNPAGLYGGGSIFPDRNFDILMWTDVGAGDVSRPISYMLTVPEPTSCLLGLMGCCLLIGKRRSK